MGNDFDPNNRGNGFNSGRVSERDQLERESGKQPSNNNNFGLDQDRSRHSLFHHGDSGGMGGRHHFGGGRFSGGGRGYGGGSGDSNLKLFLIIGLIVVGCIVSVGGWKAFKSQLNAKPEQHVNSMFQTFDDTNTRSQERTKAQLAGKDPNKAVSKVYDYNKIYRDTLLDQQMDKTYLVYAYTGKAKYDKPFNKFVLAQDKAKVVKVYRISMDHLTASTKVGTDYKSYVHPAILIYNEPTKDYKVLDGVVNDPSKLNTIIPHVQKLIKQRQDTGNRTTGGVEKPDYMQGSHSK